MSDRKTSFWHAPVGILEITISNQSVLSIKKSNIKIEQISDDPLTQSVIDQLSAYLNGNRQTFDLPTRAEGTPFQQAVWKALMKIPVGQTRTYAEVASMIGRPNAARAVGNALNRNPLCIVVPCHRVTSATGLGGYAYGLAMKESLLRLENAIV